MLSPWSLREDGFCRNELLFAQAAGVPILPVRVAEVVPPLQIISLNYLDAFGDRDAVFARLPQVLEAVLRDRCVSRREWPGVQGGPPWWAACAQLAFQEELRRHGGSFVGRDWLFDRLGKWARRPESRLLLLTADAGVGKSAVAAQATARLNVCGLHFCTRSKLESCGPVAWIQELVYQLASRSPPYREYVGPRPPADWNQPPEALFRGLITEALQTDAGLGDTGEPWILVVDGLDESLACAGPALIDLLADVVEQGLLPSWWRVLATSRPDRSILARFRIDGSKTVQLNAEYEENLADLDCYVAGRVERLPPEVLPEGRRREVAARVTERAGGNFLFARMALDALADPDPERRLGFEELDSLPPQLGGIYHQMFRKRFPSRRTYEQEISPLLECLTAARDPLPDDLLLQVAGLGDAAGRRGLLALSQFLRQDADGLSVFHKSLSEWLMDPAASAEFAVGVVAGHGRLASALWQDFQAGPEHLSAYADAHLHRHLAEAGRWEDLARLLQARRDTLLRRWVVGGAWADGLFCLPPLVDALARRWWTRVAAAGYLTQLARIHLSRGEYDVAERQLGRVLDIVSVWRAPKLVAIALHELGSMCLYRGDVSASRGYYLRAARICRLPARALYGERAANQCALGVVALHEADCIAARGYFQRTLRWSRRGKDVGHEIAALRGLGQVAVFLGEFEEGETYLLRSLVLAEQAGDVLQKTRALLNRAWIHIERRDPARALLAAVDFTGEARIGAVRAGALFELLECFRTRGVLFLLLDDLAEAEACFQGGLRRLATGPGGSLLGKRSACLRGLACVAHRRGSLAQAEELYRRALADSEAAQLPWLSVRNLVGLSGVLAHTGRASEAERGWAQAEQLARNFPAYQREVVAAAVAQLRKDPRAIFPG